MKKDKNERLDRINELAAQREMSYGEYKAKLRRERMKLDEELRLRGMSQADNGQEDATP